MHEPGKRDGASDPPRRRRDDAVRPTLYSSVVQTEAMLRQISLSRAEPVPIADKAGVRQLNFPLAERVYDYAHLVDVGTNSGAAPAPRRPRPRDVVRATTQPRPVLSDYYRPTFDNAQRVRTHPVTTVPELTVQYDGMAVSRYTKEIDDLVFT